MPQTRLPKYKKKKTDTIDDVMSTLNTTTSEELEILKETIPHRAQNWKRRELEDKIASEEWKKAQEQKIAKYKAEMEKRKQQLVEINRKVDFVLHNSLTEEAFKWLEKVHDQDPIVGKELVKKVISDQTMSMLDSVVKMLNEVIVKKGGIPMNGRINLADLVAEWRKITGVRGKIMVRNADGTETELSEFVAKSGDNRDEN